MEIPLGSDLRSAFDRFREKNFGQANLPGPVQMEVDRLGSRAAPERKEEYASEETTVTLPGLDPPLAIRERKARPADEVAALVERVLPSRERAACKTHLLIPFYSDTDPVVPIYRESSAQCSHPGRTILLLRLSDGQWFMGATNSDSSPSFVKSTRSQIEKALMRDVDH
jgi:hypothetical protein